MSFYQAEVAPLTILPLTRSPLFSYSSSELLEPGTLVRVPFGPQELRGVVISCATLPGTAPTWLKSIQAVIQSRSLTLEQIELARQMSEEYFAPFGKTLVHCVAENRRAGPPIALPADQDPSLLEPTTTRSRSAGSRFSSLSPSLKKSLAPLLVRGRHALSVHPEDRDAALVWLITERQKKYPQSSSVLILVPEILEAELLSVQLAHFDIRHVLITSSLTKTALRNAWEAARVPGVVVVGTRQALFAPLTKLGSLFVIDPGDDAYKQWDMAPRYDGRRAAVLLARLFGADMISLSPFLDTAGMAAQQQGQLTHTDLTGTLPLAPLEIVNLRLERYRKNYSPLSIAAREHIGHALVRQEKIVLIANQSGYSKITICESCKKIFRCPHCESILHPEKSGRFGCLACGFATSLFPGCPGCGHLNFKQIGFGTERIEKEMRKLFPRARIERFDQSALHSVSHREKLVGSHLTHAADILVGVPSALNLLSDPSLRTVVFVDADSFLSWTDFRTDERFAERIFRARLLASATGRVFLETFQPESVFVRRLASESPQHITETFCQDREALSYPPFSRLIAIEVLRDTQTLADEAAEKLAQSLRALPESEKWRIFIQKAPSRRFREQYRSGILLRTEGEGVSPSLSAWLSSLPKDTFVDRDPISIHV